MTVAFAIGQEYPTRSGPADVGKTFINVIVSYNGEFLDRHGYHPARQIMWGLEIYEGLPDLIRSISDNFSSRSAMSAFAFPGG